MHIKIKKGLDIPLKGKPCGDIQTLVPSGKAVETSPSVIALDLTPFENMRFSLLSKVGEKVTIGQPILEEMKTEGRFFVSPAAGTIKEVRRGYKRALQYIVIETDSKEEFHSWNPMNIEVASKEEIIKRFMEGGVFSSIHTRPFNMLADPNKLPNRIFVKAIESAPFVPPAEMQVKGHEESFQIGLNALSKISNGKVHLTYRINSASKAFTEARGVEKHTAEGPHPIGTHSLHIQFVDPIKSVDDIVWTLDVADVINIGTLMAKGRVHIDRVISIAGPGLLQDRIGYFKGRLGLPISHLISGRIPTYDHIRFISGDPLMGRKVSSDDFLGFNQTVFCAIPENEFREALHFFKLGINKYSFSKAYVSGHLNNEDRSYDFTTNQHGEHRAFIDPTLYDKVMPLPISTMALVKAVMAEDYELAEKLGFLSVSSEDFALPTFVCPSKIEMTEIIKHGLRRYAAEMSE